MANERKVASAGMALLAVAGSLACTSDDDTYDATTDGALEMRQQMAETEPGVADAASAAAAEREKPLSSCDQPLDAHGIAFVDLFFSVSDYCPARRMGPDSMGTTQLQMLRDDAGRTCLRGRITDGWAQLIVGFDGSNRNGSMPLPPGAKPLDAQSAGIDGVQFTLDSPPGGGLTLSTAYVVGEGCFPGRCELHGEFYIMDANGLAHGFDRSGAYSFHLSDFEQAPWGEPGLQLDTTHLAGMFFHLPTGAFDFCLSGFHFLDLDGTPVR